MTQCDKCDGSGRVTFERYPSAWLQCSRCLGSGQALTGIAYAGIGSRSTPSAIAAHMGNAAMQLALRHYILRSGGAKPRVPAVPDTASADQAFEAGCDIVKGRKIIRIETMLQAVLDHAAHFHPNWGACDEYARTKHARNSLIMLGDWLDDPVRFVVCWTPNGEAVGGTGQALRIAAAYNIPVWNFAVHTPAQFMEWLG